MPKEYIEREALLNEIEEKRPLNWTDTEAEITEQLDYDTFENLVKSQPTADVQEVRHGKWLPTRHPDQKRCSVCDVISFIALYPCIYKADYCPNCGAIIDKD